MNTRQGSLSATNRYRPKWCALFVCWFTGLTGALSLAQTASIPDSTYSDFENKAAAEWNRGKLGSVTFGIVTKDGLSWKKSFGSRTVGESDLADESTIYRIGSITKLFTAVMLLQLVEQGTVLLSDPVEQYYPEINLIPERTPGAPPITLLQLAHHTSGLAAEPDPVEPFASGTVRDWEKTLIRALPETKFIYDPGSHHSYSNIGYAILGAALARAADKPYMEYVDEKILRPLGMTSTTFELSPQMRSRLANGYLMKGDVIDGELPEGEHSGRGYRVPNGGLYTTVIDMARFCAFLMGNGPETVLSKQALKENQSRVVAADAGLTFGYGLGFEVFRRGDFIFYGHGGGVAGYAALLMYDPLSQTGVIILHSGSARKFNGLTLGVDFLLSCRSVPDSNKQH
jgi:CubicO group peptidase (beta-lactamase class C family)